MYTINTSYKKTNYVWAETDLSAETLETLLSYQDVRVSLVWDDDIERDFFFSINRTFIINANRTLTLVEWVATLIQGDLVLTDKARGLVDVNCVVTHDLFSVASTFGTSNLGYGEGVQIPEGFDTDLRFKGALTEGEQLTTENLAKNCIASVNGIIYPIVYSDGWAYIENAVAQMRLEEESSVQLIDFTAVGGIDIIPLTEENTVTSIRTLGQDRMPQTNVRIDLGESATQKVPLVVADGYLNVLNGTYKLLEADTLLYIVDHFSAIKRSATKPKFTRSWIDPVTLSGEGLAITSFDAQKYMIDNSSFVILINNTDLAMFKETLQGTGLPKTYYHHRIPKGPIFFQDGLCANGRVMDYNEFSAGIISIMNRNPIHTWEVNSMYEMTSYVDNGFKSLKERYKEAYVYELYSFA